MALSIVKAIDRGLAKGRIRRVYGSLALAVSK